MKTKDYFYKELLYPPPIIILGIFFILNALIYRSIQSGVLAFYLVIIIASIIIICQRNNIYTFNQDSFTIHYPRRILAWRTKKIFYSVISEMIFKLEPIRGEGKIILIRTINNDKMRLFYSSFMNKDEREDLIQEFRKRVGNEKVISEFNE